MPLFVFAALAFILFFFYLPIMALVRCILDIRDLWRWLLDSSELQLFPNGTEVFTPRRLKHGRIYMLTLSGCYKFYEQLEPWDGGGCRSADAVWFTNEQRNFWHRYPGVLVDGLSTGNHELVCYEEERALHQYTYLVEGGGERIPIRLEPPGGPAVSGNVSIDLIRLPKKSPLIRHYLEQRQAEQRRQQKLLSGHRGDGDIKQPEETSVGRNT